MYLSNINNNMPKRCCAVAYSTHGCLPPFSLQFELSYGTRYLPWRDSCFLVYCPSSISSFDSGTRSLFVVPWGTTCGLSLFSSFWLGIYWSEILSPALASGSGCTLFWPFSHQVQPVLNNMKNSKLEVTITEQHIVEISVKQCTSKHVYSIEETSNETILQVKHMLCIHTTDSCSNHGLVDIHDSV